MGFRGFLLIIGFVAFLLWSSFRGGYQAALEDVRYGNVHVVCEVCPNVGPRAYER